MKDGKVIHFLKNFPAWIVLLALTIVFAGVYYLSNDNSFKEWTSLVLASLFTALGVQRLSAPEKPANTETGDVLSEHTENLTEEK